MILKLRKKQTDHITKGIDRTGRWIVQISTTLNVLLTKTNSRTPQDPAAGPETSPPIVQRNNNESLLHQPYDGIKIASRTIVRITASTTNRQQALLLALR